jgi:hypothetical protein
MISGKYFTYIIKIKILIIKLIIKFKISLFNSLFNEAGNQENHKLKKLSAITYISFYKLRIFMAYSVSLF